MTRWYPRLHLLILFLATCCLTGCPRTPANAPVPIGLSDGEERALRVVQTVLDISRDEGEAIWPGYAPHQIPLLIFRPGKRSFLINPVSVAAERARVERSWLSAEVYVLDSRSLQVSRNLPYAKEFELDGNRVFLVRHLDRSKDAAFLRLLVHEVFHFHQLEHWEPMPQPETCRYPYDDVENVFLTRLEDKALALLLALEDPEAVDEKARLLVGLRSARYGGTSSGEAALGIESWEELVEGTARYVEEMYAIAAGYATRGSVATELVSYLARLRPRDLQKWRYYRTGATLAMVLDHLGVMGWKQACSQGSGPFFTLLEHVTPLTVDDARRMRDWRDQFADEREDVAAGLEEYKQEEEAVLEKWRGEGQFEVSVTFPARGTAYYTNRGLTMLLPDCSRLASGIVSFVDRSYDLEVEKRGIAVSNDDSGFAIRFHHDLKPGSVELDGRAVGDEAGEWAFQESIRIDYPQFRLAWQGRGKVVRTGRTFRVVLVPPGD